MGSTGLIQEQIAEPEAEEPKIEMFAEDMPAPVFKPVNKNYCTRCDCYGLHREGVLRCACPDV